MRTLYLCGAGNAEGVRLALRVHARERRWDRLVLLDDDPSKHGGALLGVPIVGPFHALADAVAGIDEAVNLVARTTAKREAARRRILAHGVSLAGLIHPTVDLLGAEVAADVLVYEGAVVGPGTTLGPGSVVFMGAVVGHGSRVGEGCVLAAGSVLNARVVLDDRVYVGTNAAVLPEVRVGEGATVGACSAVVADVPAGATALGVPASALEARAGGRAPSPVPRRADELEALIADLWAELLQRPSISPHETFFDAGGTSLLALQACARLGQTLGAGVPPTDLFRFPTARSLAGHLAGAGGGDRASAARERGAARRAAQLRRT